MVKGTGVGWKAFAACLVAFGLAAGGECVAKEEKKATPSTSFGSFGSSSTGAKKADAGSAAPARPAAQPAAQPVVTRRQDAGQNDAAQPSAAKQAGASTSFGQFGAVKKTVQAEQARADGAAPALADSRAPEARKGSATGLALERAAAQAEALRTLDARRSGAVSLPGPVVGAGLSRSDLDAAGRQRGAQAPLGSTSADYDAARHQLPLPSPSVGQSGGTVYVERSSGPSDLATGIAIGRSMRPPVVVRDSGASTDWGLQPSGVGQVPSAGAMPTGVPTTPAVQEPSVRVPSAMEVEEFPWGTAFGLCLLVVLAVCVVAWMLQARPAQKKRYSL